MSIPSSTQSVILVRNAGDHSEFLSDIYVKIWMQKGRFIFDGLQFEKPRCLVILVKGRLAVRLKSGVRFDELRPLYEDREKVTVTARGVILHPAEQHARVTPDIQGGTYSSEHMARRASGAPVVPARSWHVRARGRTDEWIVHSDVSRVRRCTRIAFPLGLLPIFVGRPLIGNNRLDGFAADFTVCSNEGDLLSGGKGKEL